MRLKVVNQLNCFPQGTCVGVFILLSLLFISFAQISRATEVPTVQTITTRHNNKRRNHTSDVTSSSLQLTPPLPLSPPSSILPLLPVKSSSSTFEQQVLKGLSIHRSRRDSFPSSGRRRHQRRGSPPHTPITGNKEQQELFLDVIDEVTRGGRCRMKDPPNVFLPSAVTATQELVSSLWKMKSYDTANRVSLLASLLAQYQPSSDHYKMLRNALDQLVRMDKEFFRARIAWTKSEKSSKDELMAEYFVHLERKRRLSTESYNKSLSLEEPWFKLPTSGRKNQYLHQLIKDRSVHISTSSFSREELSFSEWTPVYFSCELRKWLISFTSFIVSDSESLPGSNLYSLRGVISIDIDITETDFNQCDIPLDELDGPVSLIGTHKCDRESSLCTFHPGLGWRKGGYTCVCKDGFSSSTTSSQQNKEDKEDDKERQQHVKYVLNGTLVESAWKLKNQRRGMAYDMIYTCKKCGCDNCIPGCSSTTEWIVKSSLTIVGIICVSLVILLVYYTCWY